MPPFQKLSTRVPAAIRRPAISGGLAREETGTAEQPDPAFLARFLTSAQMEPGYTIGMLR